MRHVGLSWIGFAATVAVLFVPAWQGLHFRSFLPFLGLAVLAAVAGVTLLWLMRDRDAEAGQDD